MMKQNLKFFAVVLSLLLLSALVLTGCMYAIAADRGGTKPYDLNGQTYNSEGSGGSVIVDGDAPTAQETMQEKFEAMYEISEDRTSMTVISEDYLGEYWRSNYEKEVIHSLSTEEVYFVIQDSIRIYFTYDKVILREFASVSSDTEVSERFPFLKEQEILRFHFETSIMDWDTIASDIHKIILYRLAALSSPKAFFFGWEAILFAGRDPALYSSLYPETLFYIPGYSASTDRDYILLIMGGTTDFTDLESFPDLFEVSIYGYSTESFRHVIYFSSIANGSTTQVYPPEDMFALAFGKSEDSETSEENLSDNDPAGENNQESYTPVFQLDPVTNTFVILLAEDRPDSSGTYVQEKDTLILYADGNFRYVFYLNRDGSYAYMKGESVPIPGYEFEDWKIFYLVEDRLVSDLA